MRLLRLALFALAVSSHAAMAGTFPNPPHYPSFNAPRTAKIVTFSVPNSVSTTVLGINASGVIVGQYSDSDNVIHGFVRGAGGKITTVDVNGAGQTILSGIASDGTAVGTYMDSKFHNHGFVRKPNGNTTKFQARSSSTSALAINDSGEVAGTYFDGDFVVHGFTRSANGTIETFSASGELNVGGINKAGTVVGTIVSNKKTFGYTKAKGDAIATFSIQNVTFPEAINAKSMTAGYVRKDTDATQIGFTRSKNGVVNKIAIKNDLVLYSINDDGACAGVSGKTVYAIAPGGNITTYKIPGSNFTYSALINAKGVIAGSFQQIVNNKAVGTGYVITP